MYDLPKWTSTVERKRRFYWVSERLTYEHILRRDRRNRGTVWPSVTLLMKVPVGPCLFREERSTEVTERTLRSPDLKLSTRGSRVYAPLHFPSVPGNLFFFFLDKPSYFSLSVSFCQSRTIYSLVQQYIHPLFSFCSHISPLPSLDTKNPWNKSFKKC